MDSMMQGGATMDYTALRQALMNEDTDTLLALSREIADAYAGGGSTTDPVRAMEALAEGMSVLGDRFDKGEVFLAQFMRAGDNMRAAADILVSALEHVDGWRSIGRAILCTVRTDTASLGKDFAKAFLLSNGIEVLDLGTNVEPERVFKTARNENIHVIALSGTYTSSIEAMKELVRRFEDAGVRDTVKILVGGRIVAEAGEQARGIAADAFVSDARETADICRAWLEEMR
jgi:dimethylamine corrinoid protein